MPEIDKVPFDGDASGVGPYYIDDDVIQRPDGKVGLWLVYRTKISSTTHKGEAVLHRIESPTEDQRSAAKEWDPLARAWVKMSANEQTDDSEQP